MEGGGRRVGLCAWVLRRLVTVVVSRWLVMAPFVDALAAEIW